ncbi:MAG: TolC family protein [Deltaproteobacteria bacterium]|nr:TolC family protein [Deltaproteobacteria bacterium]
MNRFTKIIFTVWVTFLLLSPLALAESNAASGMAQRELTLPLDKAIKTALANNTLIREAIEKQKAAVEEKNSAKANFFPKASASYSYTNLKEKPYTVFSGNEIPMGNKDNYHWDVSLVQPIFTGFALSTIHEMAKLGVDLRGMEKKRAILDVTRQVKVAYFNILLAKKFFTVADEAVKDLESHVRDAQLFYDQEMIPYNDLLKPKVALANAVQNRARAETKVDMAVSSLNTLLRLDLNKKTEVEDISHITPLSYDLKDLTGEAVQSRPELRAFQIALQNADNAVRLAKSSYYPEVSLIGNYEQQGDNPGANNNDYGNRYNASATVQARWKFFEWGKTKADVRKYLHEKKALAEKLKGAKDSIELEVKNAFLNLQVSGKNIRTAEESLGQAKENYRITNLQYRQQMTTSTEVLDARTFLSQAETNYYGALYGYMISEAELERAVGRGPGNNLTVKN